MAATTFGPYQLIRKIAQGGMAEVFLATRRGEFGGFSKQVAIKRIYEHLAEDPELITMFFDEGRIAARLNHSNIVQIYDLGQIDNCFYIAMEFVNGCDLRTLCERGLKAGQFIPLPMAVQVIAAAATGLNYAHSRLDDHGDPLNIVHRDVSPQNVLISMGGDIKLCDFGIAKAEARLTQTQTGQFKGKFAYMSPEQVLGEGKTIDHRSDLFSLGTLLYEITVCTRLFRGKNDYDTIRMVAEADVKPPTQVRQGFPPDLEHIILKSLSRRPEHRYQSAEQMQMALEEWLLDHRAKTSAVHIARYMQEILPELVERGNVVSTQQLQAPEELARAAAQATAGAPPPIQQGARAEQGVASSAPSPFASYDDAGATGELDVQTFRAALENDQGLEHAYASAISPHYAVASPQGASSPHISAQWSSVSPQEAEPTEEEFEEERTRIIAPEAPQRPLASPPSPPHVAPQPVSSSLVQPSALSASAPQPVVTAPEPPQALERPASGQWQGPSSYAQASGQWSSVPQEPRHHAASQPAPEPAAPQPAGAALKPASEEPSALPAAASAYLQDVEAPASLTEAPASDWNAGATSATMIQEFEEVRKGSSRKKLLYALVTLVALGGLALTLALIGIDRPETTLSEGNAPIDEALLKTPLPEPLARVSVPIQTSPEGAHVVINGELAPGTTPGEFELLQGRPNELLIFSEGHRAERLALGEGEAPEPIALKPSDPVDPERASSIEIESEPLGALVFHNGQQIGPTPVTLQGLDPDALHHLLLRAPAHHDYGALLQPIAGERERLKALLDPESLRSKGYYVDLSLETIPRGALVKIDGEPVGTSPALKQVDRHGLYRVTYEAPNYQTSSYLVEARSLGTLMLRPRLEAIKRDKGAVTLTLPSSAQEVYLGNNQYKLKELKRVELMEGTYPIVFTTSEGTRYEAEFEVIADQTTRYKLDLLNGKARVRALK